MGPHAGQLWVATLLILKDLSMGFYGILGLASFQTEPHLLNP